METPIIPSENADLIALVRKRDRHFLTQWLVSTALTTVLAIACFGFAMNSYGLLVAILLALVLVVLPFLLCGGIEWVTDRGFTSTVESLDFSVRLETHDTLGVVTVKGIGRKRVKRATAIRSTTARSRRSPTRAPTRPAPSASPGTPNPFPCARATA